MNAIRRNTQSGAALLVGLFLVVVLTVMAGSVALYIGNTRSTLNQATAWQEALNVAEAGVHRGIAQLDQELASNANAFTTFSSGTTLMTTGSQTYTLGVQHAGEGATGGTAAYTITGFQVSTGGMQRPYFVINSTGTVPIGGSGSISMDSKDVVLRKLNLANAKARTATRKLEVWVRPVYNSDYAVLTGSSLDANSNNITIDGFNSTDPLRSFPNPSGTSVLPGVPMLSGSAPPAGVFDVATSTRPAIYNANVATDGSVINAGNAYIYGDAKTNGGIVANSTNVQGLVVNDFYQPIAPVAAPTGAFTSIPTIKSATTLYGGTKASPTRYTTDLVKLNGANDLLTFSLGYQGASSNSASDPTKAYIELYVTGNFNTTGGGNLTQGAVYVMSGVFVKIFIGGNLDVTGNGMVNANNAAANLTVNMINPASGPQTATFSGNSNFFGVIDAPGADVKIGGTGVVVGSVTAKSATLVGNTTIHYDEALGGSGLITRFTIANWFEDVKKF